MKQVKTWIYILIMYVCVVVVDLIKIVLAVYSGTRQLPFGWGGEIGASMVKCIVDLIFVVLIGYGVEIVIRKFTEKTLIPNVIITVILYELLSLGIKALTT